jgi:hypothetical protein
MHTWRSHLRTVLFRLARTHGNNAIADIERTLSEVFDGPIEFRDLEDQPLSPDIQLRDLLDMSFRAVITVDHLPSRKRTDASPVDRTHAPADHGSRFQPEVSVPEHERVDWFIREFNRLEQSHEFMWAGYIVKELLPRLGITTAEARELLDEFQADGIVTVKKIPNPRNPEHPASAVELQRDHERVQAVLEGVAWSRQSY